MSATRTYEVRGGLAADQFAALVDAVGRHSALFGIVVRNDLGCDANCKRLLAALEPHLLTRDRVSEWPGTLLYDGRADLYTYTVSPSLLEIITAQASGISEWLQPGLPEDPWFARQDGTVLMETISHEADVLLRLSDRERLDLETLGSHLVEVESEG